MTILDRHYSSGEEYRFGFQGQETDDEVNGQGNSIYFKYRVHDPRIGRFASVDPLAPKYPYLSPYHFSHNSPIFTKEFEGLEGYKSTNAETVNIHVTLFYILQDNEIIEELQHFRTPNARIKYLKKYIKKFNKADFTDSEGRDIELWIDFRKIEDMGDYQHVMLTVLDDDIYNPSMFLANKEVKSETTRVDGQRVTSRTEGGSRWMYLGLTGISEHTFWHELFHNFIHNHLNAPEEFRHQIDVEDQELGHTEAGGIFIYANELEGIEEQDLNQKNIDDMLRSLPEHEIPIWEQE